MASSSNMTCSNTFRRNSMPASFGNRGSLASVDSTQASSFPSKLYNILDSEEECISWMPHGRTFLVHDTEKFMEDIAPRYFKMLKYRSFTRQLNLWGFKKIMNGRDKGAWYHNFFIRGDPDAMINMVRIKIKGKKDSSGDAEADTEDPDFYQTISLSNFNESQNTKPSSNEHGIPHEVSAKVMANVTCFQQPSMLHPMQSQMQSQFNDFDNMAMHFSHQQQTANATFSQQFRGEMNHRQHDPDHFRRFSDMTAPSFPTSSFVRNVSDAASERYYRNNQAPMSQTTQSSPHVPPPRNHVGNNIHGHMRFQPEQSDYASSLVHRKLERDIIQRQYNSNFTPSNFFRKKSEASMICGGCSDYSQPLRAGESSNARKFGPYVNDGEASSFAHQNSGRFNMDNVPDSMLSQMGNHHQEAYSSCDDFSKFIGDTIQNEEADNHGN